MKTRILSHACAALGLLLLPVLTASELSALWLATPAGAALSASSYRVGALCSMPQPGHAGCLGLRLVAKQPLAQPGARALASSQLVGAAPAARPATERVEFKEPWAGSLTPHNLLSAYNLLGTPAPATTQTLAIVDAFNDPTAEHDLKVFDEQYGLPACTSANGCFSKIELGAPATDAGWAQEIATDIEVAHGVCPSCKILLVEAQSNSYSDLEAAEQEAESHGAGEISNSWGGSPQGPIESGPFNHPGTVITASSGDDGYLGWNALESSERGFADYPAASPHVVAVGGTRLSLTNTGAWKSETAWNGDGAGGGGCSTVFSAPPWQSSVAGWASVGCGAGRAVADISAVADPYTGVAVYDSTPIVEEGGKKEHLGWETIGGTSVASPVIAATFALAGGAGTQPGSGSVSYPARSLYESLAAAPASLHDVTQGSNGSCSKPFNSEGLSGCSALEESASCSGAAICLAHIGYDGPSGVGTPNGIGAFAPRAATHGSGEGGKGTPEVPSSSQGAGTGGGSPGLRGNGTSPIAAGSPSSGAPLAQPTAHISLLALNLGAILAQNHGRVRLSQLSFAFTLSAPARVRVTLAKRVRMHGPRQWKLLGATLTISAGRGRVSRHLSGREILRSGRYRLTLSTQRGAARSIAFSIG